MAGTMTGNMTPLPLRLPLAAVLGVLLATVAILWSHPRDVGQQLLVHFPRVRKTSPRWAGLVMEGPGHIVVSLEAGGAVRLQVGEAIDQIEAEELERRLRLQLEARRDKAVYLDISPEQSYAAAVRLIDQVRGLGGRVLLSDADEAAYDIGWTP